VTDELLLIWAISFINTLSVMLRYPMASRLLRRSGIAVGQLCDYMDWIPDVVYQVGIGYYDENHDAYVLKYGHEEGHVVLHKEWPDTRFVGCEPHPELLKKLTDPRSEHRYPGRIHECALGDRCGTAVLYSKRRHKVGSSLHPHHERNDETYQSYEVPLFTMDQIWYDPVNADENVLLWLDCEGSELDVLRGGEKFLDRVGILNVELTSSPPGDGWCDPSDVHWWLWDRGFLNQWKHSDRMHIGQWDGIYVRPWLFRPDLCCDPPSIAVWKRWKENEDG